MHGCSRRATARPHVVSVSALIDCIRRTHERRDGRLDDLQDLWTSGLAGQRDRLRDVGPGRLDRLRTTPKPRPHSIVPSRSGCNFFDTAWGYGSGQERADPRAACSKRHPGQAALRRHQDPARRTSRGPRGAASRSMSAFPPTTSANTPRRAWRTWASPPSTSSSSTSGKTPGRATTAGSAQWTTSSGRDWSGPSA